ncbi:MAG: COX15/CtaA family protein [Solirubrobacterales bacterium]
MNAPASRGEADESLGRFRRLAGITIVATLVLVLIGGIVRVSDSGLGCGPEGSGTHGWPLCEGGVVPAGSSESVIEYSHRIAATVVGVLILALFVIAWRRLRDRRGILYGSIAAGVLVLAQAGLGGLTVEEGLNEYLVATHLGLAMLLLGLLIGLRRAATPRSEPVQGSRGLRGLAVAASVLVLATIVAGGLVAGTEGEGKPSEPVLGAHTACGEQFPACLDRFMPFGESRLVDIQLTHRAFMYLAALAVLAMTALALRQGVRERSFWLASVVLAAQIALGIANVLLGKHAGLIAAHLMLGTVLWCVVMLAATSLLPASVPAGRRVGAPTTSPAAA